ncbi:MAG: hypothetical protein J4400_00075 [Candidatus Aenigmarchaeota archaeon]|nr:hypothetical protein [Candidatus Aenigmarchaeota archaeon]
MALEDIGYMIFGQFLGMTQYPGAPFTGNIYRDLIMFLLVPTIFIIMVLYIMSGRIIPNRNFRIMLGVGAYLFIIAGGYYSFFALLAGPYFIFLIFILGVLGYLARHFRPGGGGGPYSRGGGYSRGEHRSHVDDDEIDGGNKKLRNLIGVPRTISPADRKWLKDELRNIDKRITSTEKNIERAHDKPGTGDIGRLNETLERLIRERQRLEDRLD